MSKELNVKELPDYRSGVLPTGEIGVHFMEGRWERDGQKHLCPLSRLILEQQPTGVSWLAAASQVTGWTMVRVLAFKLCMAKSPTFVTAKSPEAKKGKLDATLYDLLYKLSRKNPH